MANTGGEKKQPKKKASTTRAKKTTKKAAEKMYGGENIWTAMNTRPMGHGFGGNQYDEPKAVDLIGAFNDVVYSCIKLIAPSVAAGANKYKLVVATSPRDPSPKSTTKSLAPATKSFIETKYPEYTRRSLDVEEVVDHAVLDLLDKPNPVQSFKELVEIIAIYMDLVGSAFVHINKMIVGTRSIPTALWIVPSQYVTIEADEAGKLTGYRYKCGETERLYAPDEIIHFRDTINPADPYTGFGVSPARAAWARIQLLTKEQASWDSVLNNMSFPTILIHPPEGENYTPQQAERVEKQLAEKGRLGNQGGIWVVTENMKLEAFSTRPKDLSALQLYTTLRTSVALAYTVPTPMLDFAETSAEASDTVRRNFERYCVSRRVDTVLETLSHHLCPARMWLVADTVSPDKVFILQEVTALVGGGVIQVNEGRVKAGYAPDPRIEGKYQFELMTTGTASAQTFQASYTGGQTKSIRTKRYQSSVPDPRPLAEALKGVFGKLAASITGKLKSPTATEVRTKSFFPLETWTDELKQTLTPVLRTYFDEGMNAVLAEVGGSPEIGTHAVQNLNQAVDRAVLHLAESTLSTTELSVEEAVAATREAIRNGLDHGEAHDALGDRIKGIFEDLTDRRCVLIAETESSRAKHNGELLAIESSGIEAKKVWLPDSMACDQCRKLAAKGAIPITKEFATIGSGPYSRIDHPPAHPACRCTMEYDLGD
jgi:phage portal protein BeeE